MKLIVQIPCLNEARDIATGLRMGVEVDLRITRTVEKLNRVLSWQPLTPLSVHIARGFVIVARRL